METIPIELPRDVIHIFKVREKELPKVVRELIAVTLYEEGRISLGKAAELAGVSRWEMSDILAAKRIPIQYYPEDLDEDIETLKEVL
jgi:predicted HTH domain antitoxin